MIKTKRVYEQPSPDDGTRILVDRLWPRGIKKEEAKIDAWLKDLAPSSGLRKWFGHDPEKWGEFKQKFFLELDKQQEMIQTLAGFARKGRVSLLYGSKEKRFNNAVALKEYVEARMKTIVRRKAA